MGSAWMLASAVSYIGPSWSRQSWLVVRAAAVAGLAISLAGCAGLGLPFGGAAGTQVSGETTASLPEKTDVIGQVDPSDWEAVRRTVAGVPVDAATGGVEWTNPDTGSTGTIANIDPPIERGGMPCRPFATTVSDTHGVRLYRGEACQRFDGRWQLYGMIADDQHLS